MGKLRKINLEIITLFFLVFIGFILRIYRIDSIPGFLNRDEAAIGYNAYTILKTGRDEHGQFLPLSFESFGDWKKPVYIYLTSPLILLFGLEIFSVRLLSCIVGVLTIIVIYALAKKTFAENKYVAIISALLLTFSPWHIHYSRQAYEVNLVLFFVSLGSLLFMNEKIKLALFFFIISIFTYHGTILFVFLLFTYLILFWSKKIAKPKKLFYIGILLFIIVFCQLLEKKAIKDKLFQTSVFKDKSVILENVIIPRMMTKNDNNFLTKIFPNKYSEGMLNYFENYSNSFSNSFLFFGNDPNERYHINKKSLRLNLLALLPFYFFGIFYILKRKKFEEYFWLFWFFTLPLLPSFLVRTPSSFRNFPQVIPVIIFSAVGIVQFLKYFKNNKIKYLLLIVFTVLITLDFLKIGIDYIWRMEDGFDNYYKAVVDNFNLLERSKNTPLNLKSSHPEYSPYIFFAFYKKIPAQWFLNNIKWYPKDEEGFSHAASISDKYVFQSIDWSMPIEENTVYVDLYKDTPDFIKTKNNKFIITNELDEKIFFQFLN